MRVNVCGCWVKRRVADFNWQMSAKKQKTPRSFDVSGFSGETCLLLYALGAPATNVRVVWPPGPLIKISPAFGLVSVLRQPPTRVIDRCMPLLMSHARIASTDERAAEAPVRAAHGRAWVLMLRWVVMVKTCSLNSLSQYGWRRELLIYYAAD